MNPDPYSKPVKGLSFNDQIMNKNLDEFFGVEDADSYVDSTEGNKEVLGDYDLSKFLDDEGEE